MIGRGRHRLTREGGQGAAIRFGSAGAVVRALLAVAALFAFLSQATLVHAHFHARPASASTASTNLKVERGGQTRDLPATCPVCQTLDHSGAYLLPDAVTVPAPAQTVAGTDATLPVASASAARSHAWRSRAPPSLPA